MGDSTFEQSAAAYRQFIPDLNTPRFTTASKQDVYEYANFFITNKAPPWLWNLTKAWEGLLEEPFKGVTNDGKGSVTVPNFLCI